jgi:AAA ATPase domain
VSPSPTRYARRGHVAPPSPPASPPLAVGRTAEIARLHAWFAHVRQGARQTIFVTGEAGIGKTTLVDAFLADVAAEQTAWIGRGQCVEHYGSGEAYLPVLDALGRLGREPGGERLKEWAVPEVEQTYARARALCAQVGETPQLFPALLGLSRFYLTRGPLPTAWELGQQLGRLAQHDGTLTHRLEAHEALGDT